jgi:hypothetical protein
MRGDDDNGGGDDGGGDDNDGDDNDEDVDGDDKDEDGTTIVGTWDCTLSIEITVGIHIISYHRLSHSLVTIAL